MNRIKLCCAIPSFLRNWLYSKAYDIITQTEKAKSIYYDQFKHQNIRVIGNPISQGKNVEEHNREKIILSVGRLIRSKHFDDLISSLNLIAEKFSYPIIVSTHPITRKMLEAKKIQVNPLIQWKKLL